MQIAPGPGNQPGTTTIINNQGTPARDLTYGMVIDASSQLFPHGAILDTQKAVKILRCEMQADPQVTASANTSFVLQNDATAPTSTGTVTFVSGTNYVLNTSLGVIVGLGQKLYIKAPAALNNIQNLYLVRVEWQSL